MTSRRLPWLLLALATTAALAAFGEPPPSTGAILPPGGLADPVPVIRALVARGDWPAPEGDPFAMAASPPNVQPVVVGTVQPAPTIAAPLPWRVIGKQLAEDEGWTVFLVSGKTTRVVRAGDALDEHYRVTAIVPPTLTLLRLDRKTHRTLDIGEARE